MKCRGLINASKMSSKNIINDINTPKGQNTEKRKIKTTLVGFLNNPPLTKTNNKIKDISTFSKIQFSEKNSSITPP
ncbi:MAG: hypothetical protein EOL93_11120 [Epsilonproteobacteria bacterium]|nr:hypothetical protein [Campylobacterota bacterium]